MIEYGLQVTGQECGVYLVRSSKSLGCFPMDSIAQVVEYTKHLPPIDSVEEPILKNISSADQELIRKQRTNNLVLDLICGVWS